MLVSAKWLKSNLDKVKILDSTWFLPNLKRDAFAEFLSSHIKNSNYFSIEECSSPSNLPHMLPDPDFFANYISNLGISNSDKVVVYDNSPLATSYRCYFMLKYYGLDNVSVLNGGLKSWLLENYPTSNLVETAPRGSFKSSLKPHLVVNYSDIVQNLQSKSNTVLDARSCARFNGTELEARKNLKSGHIPNSINVPFTSVLNSDSTMKSDHDLLSIFKNNNIDLSKTIITSCGSGVTACVLAFAIEKLGGKAALYDGSWSEYGSIETSVVAK